MANFTYYQMHNGSNSKWSAVEQNCRENWPIWTCIVANIAGLGSTTLWFLVLLPQLWKNFRRRSVRGLSILWATANFTASLINIFFVFMYVHIPLYGQIGSIYSPILEFGIMLQFWAYGNYSRKEKIAYAVACLVIWGVIITLELIFRIGSIIEYAAIVLWSLETFPQIVLNMRLRTTSGQSSVSAVIATLGKTTDFIATNGLVMPLQYIIMRYFSSSVAFINGLQVAWYLGNGENVLSRGCGSLNDDQSKGDHGNNLYANQRPKQSLNKSTDSLGVQSTDSTATIITSEVKQTFLMLAIRWFCLFVLIFLLIGCVIGFVWNINSYYGLFAPLGIICFLGMTKLYLIRCNRRTYVLQNTH